MALYLVLGGARSGKSTCAEKLARKFASGAGLQVSYLATALASDEEMRERIEIHRARRPADWRTFEVPIQVADWLRAHSGAGAGVVVIDCLTLWLANWMLEADRSQSDFRAALADLRSAILAYPQPVVIVSNEVGSGIVPADPFSRRYRDWHGWLNQGLGEIARQVVWVAAGVAVDLRRLQMAL